MKKLVFSLLLSLVFNNQVLAKTHDLMDVFQQALSNDPVWLQATAENLSDHEGVPISLAALLPSLSLTASPGLSRTLSSGPAETTTSGTTKGYTFDLSLTQTLVDFAALADLASKRALSKESDALLNKASQDLMIRVSRAYFQVLSDEDNLTYLLAAKRAYGKQLEQARQQYHVGLKTITDVYTAKASYESAVADYIGAENSLANDFENLRAITGESYTSLAKLREDFPLITPNPSDINQWVTKASQQNWSIRAAQYAVAAQKNLIRKQFAGHLPNVSINASWQDQFSRTNSETLVGTTGATRLQTSQLNLNLTLPLIEGGQVLAKTRKAQYDYQVAVEVLQKQLRDTLMQTRQSYLNIVSGISKIKADRETIHSNISSLKGMHAGYHVGTETLVNVLNQQQNVFQAETQYTNDRFAYVNNVLALKQAAGTLSIEDLKAINRWLKKNSQTK